MRRLGPVFRFDRINNGFVRRNLIVVLRLVTSSPSADSPAMLDSETLAHLPAP